MKDGDVARPRHHEVTITYYKSGKKTQSGSIVLLPSIHPDDFEQVVWRAKASLKRQGFSVKEAVA